MFLPGLRQDDLKLEERVGNIYKCELVKKIGYQSFILFLVLSKINKFLVGEEIFVTSVLEVDVCLIFLSKVNKYLFHLCLKL